MVLLPCFDDLWREAMSSCSCSVAMATVGASLGVSVLGSGFCSPSTCMASSGCCCGGAGAAVGGFLRNTECYLVVRQEVGSEKIEEWEERETCSSNPCRSVESGISAFMFVCFSVCLFVCFSVCLFVSICVCLNSFRFLSVSSILFTCTMLLQDYITLNQTNLHRKYGIKRQLIANL